jgi:hypothetical protein
VSEAPHRDALLRAAGFNVGGVLSIRDYDARVAPGFASARQLAGARVAIVLGTGGRDFGRAVARAPGTATAADPLDAFTRDVVDAYVERLARAGHAARSVFYWEQCDGRFPDLVALGEAAGLGVPSRLGVLLHPEFGPWLALRALVLSSADLEPTAPLHGFAPCDGCAAPCAAACPAAALGRAGEPGTLDPDRCAAARLAPNGCVHRCASRRACVVGPEHGYAPEEEAHAMASAAGLLRRWRSSSISD